jgi:hypothetical protein
MLETLMLPGCGEPVTDETVNGIGAELMTCPILSVVEKVNV